MVNIVRKKKSNTYRNVFRKAKKVVKKRMYRLLIESLLMASLGIYIFLFLHKIPNDLDILNLFKDILSTYYQAIILLLEAFKETIVVILVFLLATLCICLFLGSFWRILKIFLNQKNIRKPTLN